MSTLFKTVSQIIVFATILFVTVVMVKWAFSPDPRPDAAEINRSVNERILAERKASEEAVAKAQDDEQQQQADKTETDANALIAAARPPEETRVQVLAAGGTQGDVDQVVTILESIGYKIIAKANSRRQVAATTIYWTNQSTIADAEALRARDPRFQNIQENAGLKAAADLHILVGPDF